MSNLNDLEIIKKAKKEGCIEISSGAYLWTKGYIIEEQKTWHEEDKAKNFDFSVAEYWITDGADDPYSVDSAKDLEEYI